MRYTEPRVNDGHCGGEPEGRRGENDHRDQSVSVSGEAGDAGIVVGS